ncbi:MAG: ferritin family protein [Pseudomonadota bacterium]
MNEFQPISCFRNAVPRRDIPAWFTGWHRQYPHATHALHDAVAEGFGEVIPMLICGEQSAIAVFENEIQELGVAGITDIRAKFASIACDEQAHEIAWQRLFSELPRPADFEQTKRRATVFFARLGRVQSSAEHFAQIAHLDSAVGVIMWHLERSALARSEAVKTLTTNIKKDEARHANLSRRYALSLGLSKSRFAEMGDHIRGELVRLLAHKGDALEAIGIDPTRLFQRIHSSYAR